MKITTRTIKKRKHIALVAHDNYKSDLLRWTLEQKDKLINHVLYATGTTGHLLSKETGLKIHDMLSGPLGGDQQLGAMIAEGKIDMMIFFWDPLNSLSHDPDIKALLRISTVWNIPIATNQSSANVMISSPQIEQEIEIRIPDYDAYLAERCC